MVMNLFRDIDNLTGSSVERFIHRVLPPATTSTNTTSSTGSSIPDNRRHAPPPPRKARLYQDC
eukprot:162553-Rhodomonas_salina.1